MESQLATYHDAELILKLYELRREEVMRKARHWLVFEFNPKTPEDFLAVSSGYGTQENAYFQQVVGYWEMAASLVLHGAVKADLFFDCNNEGLYIFAKFHEMAKTYKSPTGFPFMRRTAELIEKFVVARDRFQGMMKSIQARTA